MIQSAYFLSKRKVLHTSSQVPSNKYNVLRYNIIKTNDKNQSMLKEIHTNIMVVWGNFRHEYGKLKLKVHCN